MNVRILSITGIFAILLWAAASPIVADEIWFPSRVRNGSFEEWEGPYAPSGWSTSGWAGCSQADPLLGEYSVDVFNGMPMDGYLYQDISYRSGALLFGCAHRSVAVWGPDEIIVSYLDASAQEISSQSWLSADPEWQFILTILRPPGGTRTIRIKLRPMEDALGELIVDHVFMIPVPGSGV
jgi:hypothetical protein